MGDEITNAELARLLQRIESKLDQAISDHELRLRRLERAYYAVGGVALVGGTGIGSLLQGWMS